MSIHMFLDFSDISLSTFVFFHFSISITCVLPTAHFQSLFFLSSISLCCSFPPLPLIDVDIKSIISPFFCPFVCLSFFAQMALVGQGRPMKIDGVSCVSKRKRNRSGKNGRNKNRKMERLRGMGEQIGKQGCSICIVCMASIQQSLTHTQQCIGL